MSELRDRVKNALTGETHDPREVALSVLREMDQEALYDALKETLPNYVRLVMTSTQRKHLRLIESRDDLAQAPDLAAFANGEWKSLQDCSDDDLEDMAVRRDGLATGNATWAARFRGLAEGSGVVARDLPVLPDGAASMPVLEAKRDALLRMLHDGTSPLLEELRHRRDLLESLRDIRMREEEEHARVEAVLQGIEARYA